MDRVCFFPIGFLLVPCKVPFENAILLAYAWEEKENVLSVSTKASGKGGRVTFYCNLYFIPYKGLLAELTFSISESSNKNNLIVTFSSVLVWALFDPLKDSYFRVHYQLLHFAIHSCHLIPPVTGTPGRLNFQTQVRNQAVAFHL